jgi:hypothetical protein
MALADARFGCSSSATLFVNLRSMLNRGNSQLRNFNTYFRGLGLTTLSRTLGEVQPPITTPKQCDCFHSYEMIYNGRRGSKA